MSNNKVWNLPSLIFHSVASTMITFFSCFIKDNLSYWSIFKSKTRTRRLEPILRRAVAISSKWYSFH